MSRGLFTIVSGLKWAHVGASNFPSVDEDEEEVPLEISTVLLANFVERCISDAPELDFAVHVLIQDGSDPEETVRYLRHVADYLAARPEALTNVEAASLLLSRFRQPLGDLS